MSSRGDEGNLRPPKTGPRKLEVRNRAHILSNGDTSHGNMLLRPRKVPRKLEVRTDPAAQRAIARPKEQIYSPQRSLTSDLRPPRKIETRDAFEREAIVDPELHPSIFRKAEIGEKLDSKSHIRLAWFRPRAQGNAIQCEIYQASLDKLETVGQAQFAALSYAWGNPRPRHPIRCGSNEVLIAENLYKALLHVRYQQQRRLLWVDAISINQDDIPEKNAQVQLMGQIYKRSHVVVWLGEEQESHDTLKVLRCLKPLSKAYQDYRDRGGTFDREDMNRPLLSALGLHGKSEAPWLAIFAFF